MPTETEFDIIVVGAGPAGLGFARALRDTDLRVALIEQQSKAVLANPPEDGRDIALTHTSEVLMRDLGMWARLDQDLIGTIRDAKVLNGKSSFALEFNGFKAGVDYLGRIVKNHEIRRTAYEVIQDQSNVTLICDAEVSATSTNANSANVELGDGRCLSAKLLVAADSRFSSIRRKMGLAADSLDFGRVVIVCEMDHELPHCGTAFECFHYDQTLAILPMSKNTCSIVVTLPSEKADAAMSQSSSNFSTEIQHRFENRLGAMHLSSPRHIYPLVAVLARRFVGPRFALIGDAAVGMHPVTAHGYNLGLSGATQLASELVVAAQKGADVGNANALLRYERKHRRAVLPLYHGTNALVRLFTNDRPSARVLRNVALRLGNLVPPVRNRILHKLTDIEPHVR